MKRFILAAAFVILATPAATAAVQVALPAPDESALAGQTLPNINLIGENGMTTRLAAASEGKIMLFVPIYTHCHYACPLTVSRLKEAAGRLQDGAAMVVLFTFDPHDTAGDMKDFRRSMALPAGWKIFRAAPDDTVRLLEALDFRTMSEGRDFAHPDIVVIVSPGLMIKGLLRGTGYSDGDLASEVERARPSKTGGPEGYALIAGFLFLGALSFWAKSEGRRLNPRRDIKSRPLQRKSHRPS